MVVDMSSKDRLLPCPPRGNEARAKAFYEGVVPLTAEDIADCIAFVATRPSHVDIDQQTAYHLHVGPPRAPSLTPRA